MLPSPISFPRRRDPFLRHSARRSLDRVLRAPTRLTNFGALLLTALAAFSLYLNLKHAFFSPAAFSSVPQSINQTIGTAPHLRNLTHLVIVPAHGVWTGSHEQEMTAENSWLLSPYQRGHNRPAAFLEHVTRGAELMLQDKKSLLVFSGGQTSPESTTTEAESYFRLARAASLFPHQPSLPSPYSRVTTEVFALDSLQNLMFSIARFREFTGAYPTNITVVGYEFKRRRFGQLHRAAVSWPWSKFHYVGISLDKPSEENLAHSGEVANSYVPYTKDTYGCHGPLLKKRQERNTHSRVHAYHLSAPEIAGLLEWCPWPPRKFFRGSLPWDSLG